MSTNKLLSTLVLIFMTTLGYAQVVNNTSELNSAINAASPGTTIILANGTWNDVFIDIDKNGNAANPITITAQKPGEVLMTGNSRVYLEGAYLTVSGLVFKNPENLVASTSEIEPIIELKSCNNCKIINNKIDTYNGTEAQKELKFKWILTDGENNEIAYNSFVGKYGVGSIINDNRNSSAPDYLKIHHNYFGGRRPINDVNSDNDQDAIRIGNSGTSLDNSFSEVYNNFFYDFQGELEVISNKSGGNKYYNNTFRDYSGTLTLRHGDNCEVYGNYFIAGDYVMSGGVRVIGEGHRIYNNYIEGINSRKPDGSLSNGTGGINVSNGRPNSAVNGYYQVKNADVINNTFVNCDYALRVGTMIGSDLDEEPENLVVANNIMYNTSAQEYQIITAPSGSSVSEGNITDLTDSDIADDGNFHRLINGSAAVDAGIGTYSYLTEDILDGNRESNFDAGAEEFGANGTNLPYSGADIEVNVGFGANSSALATSDSEITFGVCGATTTFEVFANVDWTLTDNISWLILDITSGVAGTTTVTAISTENATGAERNATITINEIAGGDDATFDVSVKQLLTSISFELPIIGTTALGTQVNPAVSEENAYNDDITNYWTGNPDTEPEVSITFDLGSIYFLTRIGINFWKADERTTTFSIEVAEEESGPFTSVIDNGVSAESGVTVATEQAFSLRGNLGRYVKFIGIGNSSSTNWTSIANVNIYGDIDCENAATGTTNYQQEDLGITIFPVPITDGILNILSTSMELGIIEVFNVAGKRVLTTNGNNAFSKQIDVSKLNAGMYIIHLEKIGLTKFIVK